MIKELHLGLARAFDKAFGHEPVFGLGQRRQVAQEIGPPVADQKEVRALGVVGAARGAPGHGPRVGFSHDLSLVGWILEGTIGHGQAGAAGGRDQNRLLQLRERCARVGRLVAHGARQQRASLAYPVGAPPPDGLDERPVQEGREAWMVHQLGVAAPGMIGRQGAKALASLGMSGARSGQCRWMRLFIPLRAIQSMPSGE